MSEGVQWIHVVAIFLAAWMFNFAAKTWVEYRRMKLLENLQKIAREKEPKISGG